MGLFTDAPVVWIVYPASADAEFIPVPNIEISITTKKETAHMWILDGFKVFELTFLRAKLFSITSPH
jgi:hypothetical protein